MQPGDLLYFTPFQFPNFQNPPANKYFLVLAIDEDQFLVSSLPTSQDHVPSHLEKEHGCIEALKEDSFSCYYFKEKLPFTNCGWGFPKDTYLYGEQIKTFPKSDDRFVDTTKYRKIGTCTDETYVDILSCLVKAGNVKMKFKRLFQKTLN